MRFAYYFSDLNYTAPCAMNAAKMVSKLREKVDRWMVMWQDPRTRPELYLRTRNGATVVHDSRSGVPSEYAISEPGRALLESLGTPKKLPKLFQEFPEVDVEAEIGKLRERGLIFQENDRLLSLLVMPPTPAFVSEHHAELVTGAV
jgi:hypothetical protein